MKTQVEDSLVEIKSFLIAQAARFNGLHDELHTLQTTADQWIEALDFAVS